MAAVDTNDNSISNRFEMTNRNQHLNPKFNAWLTHCVNVLQHGITVRDKKFLKRCYNIIVLSGLPVCYEDFKDMLGSKYKGNFRAIKHKLNRLFVVVQKGKPTYYSLNGLYLDKELTDKYTAIPISQRLFASLDVLFSMTSHEIPQMHAIIIQCKTSQLYPRLLELGYSHDANKSVTINDLPIDKIVRVSVTVYSTGTMILRLGCTYSPVAYSNNGFISLISLLGKIEYCLKSAVAQKDFQIEPVTKWKLKHIDLNKDSIHYDFPTDEYTMSLVFGHVQIYNKKLPNGKQRIRVETQIDMNNTMSEELSTDRFQKSTELFD
jgi:hypothetical protein